MVALARKPLSGAEPLPSTFAEDVVAGLRSTPKRIPAKYFYDATGSRLFERITELPEYYLTRTELQILRENATEIVRHIPEHAALIEFGSGSSTKVRLLLNATNKVAVYVPVDISPEVMESDAAHLCADFAQLQVLPVIHDFTQPFDLPEAARTAKRVGFFPGSTIGNFEPHEAANFLRHAGTILGEGATLIIGFDLIKAPEILNAAYNDAQRVTEKFNLNLLTRMNRELEANFRLESFEHHAFYNRERNRIEMHLASLKRQKVRVAGETIEFRAGETIHTENSYKYSIDSFCALARGTGWTPVKSWTDSHGQFCVEALTLAPVKPKAPPPAE